MKMKDEAIAKATEEAAMTTSASLECQRCDGGRRLMPEGICIGCKGLGGVPK